MPVSPPLDSSLSAASPTDPAAPSWPDERALARGWTRVRRVLPPTPAIWSSAQSAWLKLESLQVTGSFKVRGAWNTIAAQVERGDRRPVVAASAGNHGLGVTWAARRLGLEATIVVPDGAPANKVRACRAHGAQVLVGGADFDVCAVMAQQLALVSGARFVHAFDEPDVIAGQATVGSELLALEPDVVVVPVGGGGLAAGVALALRDRGTRIVGVQVTGVDALRRVLADEPAAPVAATLADGLRVSGPGRLTAAICRALLDDVIVVEEAEVATAVARLALDEKVVAEGAGAAAVAALPRVAGARRVAIVSGGNIDAAVLARLTADAA